ncbi:carbohydrate-binding module family 13 protein [Phlebiopsis gigantea 11061_1 CR5-6]|uniref:Carbohydrate-binding module family 13 protein n=1 Tax=Phlebiopsis gigantea (strain 11061_1 CR5-6) TaxID=745531 RepID=A0A0C3S742_PHLG1|nr:carbohydrate-binding module family 13 protein [Phlebiopsis gigantea 11061_1 CR5-6]
MTTFESGVYYIENIASHTVIELTDDSGTPGTQVQGWEKRALSDTLVSAQLWIIYPVGGSSSAYFIRNAGTRTTFMELTDGNPAEGTPIISNPASGSTSQEWTITPNTAGTAYVIRNVASSTYIDLYKGNAENGAVINGWGGTGPTTGNTHQLWVLTSA